MTDNKSAPPDQALSLSWSAMLQTASLLLVPLLTLALGYQAGNRSTNKDYVAIAVDIINNKESAKPLRSWAIEVLDQLSPVDFSAKARASLEAGAPISITVAPSTDSLLFKSSIPLPRNALDLSFLKPCTPPNVIFELHKQGTDKNSEEIARSFVECSVKMQSTRDYIEKLSKVKLD